MDGINIELLVARVKEKYPKASARVFHPQSNGKLERFHSTLKTEHVRKTPYFSYEDAKEKMAQWIDFYNNGRLHGAYECLTGHSRPRRDTDSNLQGVPLRGNTCRARLLVKENDRPRRERNSVLEN